MYDAFIFYFHLVDFNFKSMDRLYSGWSSIALPQPCPLTVAVRDDIHARARGRASV